MPASLPTLLDLAAIATAGLFGSAVAVQRKMPLVGVMLISILSALGGGMIRDLLLGAPVIAMRDEWYLPTAVGAALLGMPLARRIVEHPWIGLVLDGLVLGLFAVVGTQKAYFLAFPAAACLFIGMATCIGGGLIVELLLGVRPTPLKEGPWYATAGLAGCVAVVLLTGWLPQNVVAAIAVAIVLMLRIVSERLQIAAPSVRTLQQLRNRNDR